jgi:hypothetical protein
VEKKYKKAKAAVKEAKAALTKAKYSLTDFLDKKNN